METSLLWSTLQESGLEHLKVVEDEQGAAADGWVIGIAVGAPFRLWYQVRVDSAWQVRQCVCQIGGDAGRQSEWSSDGQGHWVTSAGERLVALDGCMDIDIACTPFTNTLPIRRLALSPGESAEIRVAYVPVPSLTILPVRQRYTCLERTATGARYRYQGLESGFTADLTVDARGLVVDYRGIWRRV